MSRDAHVTKRHEGCATGAPVRLILGSMAPLTPIHSQIRAQPSTAAMEIAAIARRQHGVITYGQLVDAGLSPSTISRWAQAGHLHRLHRGVYAVGHTNLSRHGRWLAAVLACGGDAALSHGASARLQTLELTSRLGTIHVSVPAGSKRRPPGILVHRPRRLEAVDVTTRFAIPTTTATRTLFDLASTVSPRELRGLFERAEYLEALDRPRLRALLDGATGRRGLGTLRDLLGFRPLPLAETRSRLERIVLGICRTHDLPVPLVNVPLLGYVADFLWPAARFAVEADGGHHRGAQRDRDNARDVLHGRAGYLVRRYSGEALADEAAVAAEILEILRERLPAATSA